MSKKRCVDADQVAEMLSTSRWRVYQLARERIIPCVRIGRQVRFDLEAIDHFIKTGGRGLEDQARRTHVTA